MLHLSSLWSSSFNTAMEPLRDPTAFFLHTGSPARAGRRCQIKDFGAGLLSCPTGSMQSTAWVLRMPELTPGSVRPTPGPLKPLAVPAPSLASERVGQGQLGQGQYSRRSEEIEKATGQKAGLGKTGGLCCFHGSRASACPAQPGKNKLGTKQTVPVATSTKAGLFRCSRQPKGLLGGTSV